jgi:hypothetical protein
MVQKKEWKEFRKTGLLLIINQVLHIFGWAIVCKLDDNENVIEIYPARVKFRGFDNSDTDEAYQKITKYMAENSEQLLKEVSEE